MGEKGRARGFFSPRFAPYGIGFVRNSLDQIEQEKTREARLGGFLKT
jgi:hypothetical protein